MEHAPEMFKITVMMMMMMNGGKNNLGIGLALNGYYGHLSPTRIYKVQKMPPKKVKGWLSTSCHSQKVTRRNP